MSTTDTTRIDGRGAWLELADDRLFREFAYIGGKWCAADNGDTLAVLNPADQSTVGHIPAMGATEAGMAVDAAAACFREWKYTLPQCRTKLLSDWFDLILRHKEDLARIMVFESGKPLSECRGEIDYAAEFVEFYAEEAKRANIEGVSSHLATAEVELWREPVGVAALITPWNFPSAMITRKAAAAIAAGCTVVILPSAETPFSALALAELAKRAGFPVGLFNVVTGRPAPISSAWCADPRVRALSFTGSTEIGRLLYAQSAPTVKRLVMELGGHAPFIVFADADLEKAVAEGIKAKFATSGQDCLGANRIFVQRDLYDAFCTRFAGETAKLTVGMGLDDPDIGPLINAGAVEKQKAHVSDAVAKGATILTGGKGHDLFYQPTVLRDVPHDALIMREETFGPVAAITPFDTENEVTEWANDTEYGLIAYIHTQNPRRIYRMSRALEFGMVAVNRTKVTGAPIPFGGMKQSGLGREGARYGLEDFTEIKYICRDWSGKDIHL